MENKLRFLQLGGTDLQTQFHIPEGVEYHYVSVQETGQFTALSEEIFDAALLMDCPEQKDLELLSERLLPYTVFYAFSPRDHRQFVSRFLRRKRASYLAQPDFQAFLEDLPRRFWNGQYGDKMGPEEILVNPSFEGKYLYHGHNGLQFTLTGRDKKQSLISWRYNRRLEPGRDQELWLEYEAAPGVEASIIVRLYRSGNADALLKTIEYELPANGPLIVSTECDANMSVGLCAGGTGTLRIGQLHIRWSRYGSGCMMAGGQRFYDRQNQEFFTYFDPGDMKPPLNVYFSGYRTAEGFEAYHLMKKLGAPFLLIADPRLEGGAFYLGNEEFENAIRDRILEVMHWLRFDEQQLVFSGLSMGTCGAFYYAAEIQPYTVIVGKPLLNIGSIAINASRIRPDDFLTSLDVLQMAGGVCDEEQAHAIDRKMWKRLRRADFTQTRFAVAYMRQDDYDPEAYEKLLGLFARKGVRMYSKGIEGRHNDNTPAVTEWFTAQYRRILQEDFQRMPGRGERPL